MRQGTDKSAIWIVSKVPGVARRIISMIDNRCALPSIFIDHSSAPQLSLRGLNSLFMATITARPKKRPAKKKPAPKPQTLLIRKLSPESIEAIAEAKKDVGTEANTKAAIHMIEDYWFVREALNKARQTISEMEQAKVRYVRAYRDMQRNQAILAEELGNNDES